MALSTINGTPVENLLTEIDIQVDTITSQIETLKADFPVLREHKRNLISQKVAIENLITEMNTP